jgi:hypothetical protein
MGLLLAEVAATASFKLSVAIPATPAPARFRKSRRVFLRIVLTNTCGLPAIPTANLAYQTIHRNASKYGSTIETKVSMRGASTAAPSTGNSDRPRVL